MYVLTFNLLNLPPGLSQGPETGRCADLESTSWTDVKEQLDASEFVATNRALA